MIELASRLTNVSVTLPNGTVSSGYGYNAVSGRMETVNKGSEQAVYSYLANGELVEQIIFKHSEVTLMSIVRTYDKLNRLMGIENRVNGNLVAGFGYQYNSANQRIQMTLGDQSYWQYGYDYAGQVNSGKRYWSDVEPGNNLVSGQQYEYSYDGMGNRLWVKLGGDSSGNQSRINNYTPDNLNQYSLRTVPGMVDILGEVDDLAEIVRVNWNPTWRKGKYYHAPISVENTYKGSYAKISVETTQNTVEGFIQVPPLNQSFVYDDAGNMVSDGVWSYSWDADNRLVGMIRNPAIIVPSNVATNIVFTYDWQGRRIRKQTWGANNTLLMDRRYVYDGWRLMAEYSVIGSQTTDFRSYVWGLDLSGTLDGAGGVGGLLMINDAEQGAQYVCYDGNGNVVALVNAATGAVTARYEYSPFGELIRMTGPMSRRNPFRFSTKYTDDETDLVYYGYRYYSPNLGRWISRDPIEEEGGINLYGFVGNEPLCNFDSQGLANGNPVTLNISGAPYLNYASHSFPWNPPRPGGSRQTLSQQLLDRRILWEQTTCCGNTALLWVAYTASDIGIGMLSFAESPVGSTVTMVKDWRNTGSGFGSATVIGSMQDVGRLCSIILIAIPIRNVCCAKTGLQLDQNTLAEARSVADFTAKNMESHVTSPNTLMRANANKRAQYVDPITGNVVPANGILAADHIVPQSWIKKQPGFNNLTREQQSWLLNHPINTQGLTKSLNSSKGAKMPGEWQIYKKQNLNALYILNDIERREFLKMFIQLQIRRMGGE